MTRTDTASRVIAAPPDRVYAALVDPSAPAGDRVATPLIDLD